jgi:hypothetical protein
VTGYARPVTLAAGSRRPSPRSRKCCGAGALRRWFRPCPARWWFDWVPRLAHSEMASRKPSRRWSNEAGLTEPAALAGSTPMTFLETSADVCRARQLPLVREAASH